MGAPAKHRSLAALRPRHPAIPLRHRHLRQPRPPAGIRHRLDHAACRIRSLAGRSGGSRTIHHRLSRRTHPPQTAQPPARQQPIRKNRPQRRRFYRARKRPRLLGKPRQIPRHRPLPRPPQHPRPRRQRSPRQTLPQPLLLHRQLQRICRHRRRRQQ